MDALGMIVKDLGIEVVRPEPAITVERMRVAGKTEGAVEAARQIRQRVAEIRASLDLCVPDAASMLQTRLDRQESLLARAEEAVRVCEMRDDIRQERTEQFGCEPWCLGEGWKRDSELVPRIDKPGVEARPIWLYCPCPEGQEAQERQEKEREEGRRRMLEDRVTRFFGPAVPDAEYRDATLESCPNREMVVKLERWIDQCESATGKPWLYVNGGFGSCKTGGAWGLVRRWNETRGGARFVVTPNLLDEIRETYGNERLEGEERQKARTTGAVLRMYAELPFLVLDDMGAENLTERNAAWVEEQFFKILNARHNARLPTVILSNLGLSKIATKVGDRIWNRMIRMSEPVYSGEKNYRVE